MSNRQTERQEKNIEIVKLVLNHGTYAEAATKFNITQGRIRQHFIYMISILLRRRKLEVSVPDHDTCRKVQILKHKDFWLSELKKYEDSLQAICEGGMDFIGKNKKQFPIFQDQSGNREIRRFEGLFVLKTFIAPQPNLIMRDYPEEFRTEYESFVMRSPMPPGKEIEEANYHWLEKKDREGNSFGIGVFQWIPDAMVWRHLETAGICKVNTKYWRYICSCEKPEF